MKVVSKEEEQAHYSEVLRGGVVGGTIGLSIGLGGVIAASRRWPSMRTLTLPFRAFLVSSAGTFGAITTAERYGLAFQRARDPRRSYRDEAERAVEQARHSATAGARLLGLARDNRYTIVLTSWLAAMAVALALVGRNRYLTGAQKLVQARVYAQGLTLAVLVATAALETSDARSGRGRWETVMVLDPADPEHRHMIEKRVHHEDYEGQDLWMDMVAAEERRMDQQKKESKAIPQQQQQQQQQEAKVGKKPSTPASPSK